MAKTYEELEALGWENDVRASHTWFHPETGVPFMPLPGEADAEFRERLERNTPGLEAVLDWPTLVRRAKNKRRRLEQELELIEKDIARMVGEMRLHALWKITDMPEMDWGKMMDWAKDNPEIVDWKAASHGNRVEFFGLKEHGSPLIAVAMRVGWPEDMEGDDE